MHLAQAIKHIVEKDKNGTTSDLHNVVQRLTGIVAHTAVGVKETC